MVTSSWSCFWMPVCRCPQDVDLERSASICSQPSPSPTQSGGLSASLRNCFRFPARRSSQHIDPRSLSSPSQFKGMSGPLRASMRMSVVTMSAEELAQCTPPAADRDRYSRQFAGHWSDGETVFTIQLDSNGRCNLPGGELSAEDERCTFRPPNGEVFVGILLLGGRSITWSDDDVWQKVTEDDYQCSIAGRRCTRGPTVTDSDASQDGMPFVRLRSSMPREADDELGCADVLPRLLGQSPGAKAER